MRAAQVVKAGAADCVRIEEVPEPSEGAELIIDVRAAGVGFPDLLMSRGEFQIRREHPFTLGWEASGVLSAAAPSSGFAIGDRVVSMALGAYAERVEATRGLTFALPDELSFEQGAAYPHNYLTAYAGLLRRGRLRAGERVLVHGAGGGVGSAAVQVARAAEATVFAVVSSEEKAAVAREAGAEHVFRADGPWREEALEASGGGVDVVFDPVGGERLLDSLRSLALEGRLVVIGFAAGDIPQAPLNRLLMKNIDICGCSWGVLAAEQDGVHKAARVLNGWVADGLLRPLVGAAYALDDITDALARVSDRRSLAKTVLTLSATG